MLTYPDEFVAMVEEEYGDRPDVLSLARGNRYVLGRALADGAVLRMSPEEVVLALEHGDQSYVMAEASAAVRRKRLHAEWMRIVLREISCVRERVSVSWRRPESLRGGGGKSHAPHPSAASYPPPGA